MVQEVEMQSNRKASKKASRSAIVQLMLGRPVPTDIKRQVKQCKPGNRYADVLNEEQLSVD
jgi:hypothetical protein